VRGYVKYISRLLVLRTKWHLQRHQASCSVVVFLLVEMVYEQVVDLVKSAAISGLKLHESQPTILALTFNTILPIILTEHAYFDSIRNVHLVFSALSWFAMHSVKSGSVRFFKIIMFWWSSSSINACQTTYLPEPQQLTLGFKPIINGHCKLTHMPWKSKSVEVRTRFSLPFAAWFQKKLVYFLISLVCDSSQGSVEPLFWFHTIDR